MSSVKTHLATLPLQGELHRTGKSDVYQQPIAGLSPCLPSGVGSKVWDVEGVTPFALLPTDPSWWREHCVCSHTPITRRADFASRRRSAGRSRRTRSLSGRSARSTGLEDVRLVNLARQSSSSLSCGKRILSRSRLLAAAGRRREGGEGVERCRCACQVFFSCCVCTISRCAFRC